MITRRYWRIQLAGQALSRSHRSQIGWEEDELGFERGTSAMHSFGALKQWAQGGHANWIGPVDVVEFRAQQVSVGADGEPVVRPIEELRRFRITGGATPSTTVAAQLRSARVARELDAVFVPTMPVED